MSETLKIRQLARPGLMTSNCPNREFWISCSRFTLSCKIPQTRTLLYV